MYSLMLPLALSLHDPEHCQPRVTLPEPYPGIVIIYRPVFPVVFRPFPVARAAARGIGFLARRAQRPVLIPIRLGRPHFSFRAIR